MRSRPPAASVGPPEAGPESAYEDTAAARRNLGRGAALSMLRPVRRRVSLGCNRREGLMEVPPMAESMYLLDFQRMTVEKIDDPKPPPGIDTGALDVPEHVRNAEITFAACGSEPVPEDEE